MDRNSSHYLRSDFSEKIYGDEERTGYERKLEVSGGNTSDVRITAEWIRSRVMP